MLVVFLCLCCGWGFGRSREGFGGIVGIFFVFCGFRCMGWDVCCVRLGFGGGLLGSVEFEVGGLLGEGGSEKLFFV